MGDAMEVSIIPVTRFRQNCSLLRCEETNRAAIVDPGGDLDAILAEVERTGAVVEKILITHGHLDHAGATAPLAARLAVPIEGPHRADAFLVDAIPAQAERYRLSGFDTFSPSRWLEDGDTVEFGAHVLEVIHCPGHTPGHVVFFNRRARCCVVGDVIFNGSVGRSDLPRGSHDDLVTAIRGKLFPLGDDVTFFPGHGATSTFGWERRCNPFVADLMFD
jgi:hydroxyacylglutathione hydrolase